MADSVVGISFERDGRILPSHPTIERIVKKEIRQHRADDSPLRAASLSANQGPIRHAHRRPEPLLVSNGCRQNCPDGRQAIPGAYPGTRVPQEFLTDTVQGNRHMMHWPSPDGDIGIATGCLTSTSMALMEPPVPARPPARKYCPSEDEVVPSSQIAAIGCL